jgi:hypothetical protein
MEKTKLMKARSFWNTFDAQSGQLAAVFHSGGQQQVFCEVEEMLEQHGIDYCFDITANEQICCLVFSPEGDEQAAGDIDTIVASAPSLPGWKFYGRRQRKCVADVRAILKYLYSIDVLQCRFRYSPERLNCKIEIFIPISTDITSAEQRAFANTLLWHAIGDDTVMDRQLEAVVRKGIPVSQDTLSVQELVNSVLDVG